jgi:GTP-binding protein LepA
MKYDVYKGIIIFIRVIDGKIAIGTRIRLMHMNKEFTVEGMGSYSPFDVKSKELGAGEVGYITCNVREPKEVRVGDTITDAANPCEEPLEGYRQLKPLVFCGVYPVTADQYMELREAIDKLRLSDPSFTYEPETSQSFGHGFRCGFLGLLHMEVVQERLEREYNLNLVLTTPNVAYRYETKSGVMTDIENPSQLPSPSEVKSVEEPHLKVSVLTPVNCMDAVMELAKRKRGIYIKSEYISDRMRVIYDIPLAEVIVDFNDMVKSATRGYGSIDYEFSGYRPAPIAKLDILINDEPCDAFACLVHKEHAYAKGSALCDKLKELIPAQLFEIRIQATCDGRIIASSRIKSMGKNVTAKCYGGDISRKRKLWEKQKEGKKKMKQVGSVEVPQEAFRAALKI